jgi:hypothetical protein
MASDSAFRIMGFEILFDSLLSLPFHAEGVVFRDLAPRRKDWSVRMSSPFPEFYPEFYDLELALRAFDNRDKKLSEGIQAILVRILDERIGRDLKRTLIARNFVRLVAGGHSAATESLLNFIYDQDQERRKESASEKHYRALIEEAKANAKRD